MRQKLCRICMVWHDTDDWPLKCVSMPPKGQSDIIPVPYFISDTMPPTEHPLTGTFETSKSKFEQITRSRGYETVGNDPARLRPRPKPKPDEKGIRDSLEKAKADYAKGRRPSSSQTGTI